jgi:hypothetical protein
VNLIIVGLRRSGTTVFWNAFRRDSAFAAYDEPFNPMLITLPAEHRKRTRRGFIGLIDRDAESFWEAFAPIPLAGELRRGLTDEQRSYLTFLTSGNDRVVFDTTRCHFKIGDLARAVPDPVLVHLHRSAPAFASSHLLPSGSRLRRRARLASRRMRFWKLGDAYDHWGYQTLIGDHPSSAFGLKMTENGMDPEKVYSLPAAGRLLALWKVFCDEVDRAGVEHFGGNFVSLPFERFVEQPDAVLDLIYDLGGALRPAVDLNHLETGRRGYAPDDPRWRSLASVVGIAELEPSRIRIGGGAVDLG